LKGAAGFKKGHYRSREALRGIRRMLMKQYILPVVIATTFVLGSQSWAASRSEEAREKTVALSSVPQPAVAAARKALGSDPTEAKIISGTRPQQYELSFEKGSRENSVHVRADGTIVKRETENESAEHEKGERGGR
jgi:hypothetical protein